MRSHLGEYFDNHVGNGFSNLFVVFTTHMYIADKTFEYRKVVFDMAVTLTVARENPGQHDTVLNAKAADHA